jgi:hypothetical protein
MSTYIVHYRTQLRYSCNVCVCKSTAGERIAAQSCARIVKEHKAIEQGEGKSNDNQSEQTLIYESKSYLYVHL